MCRFGVLTASDRASSGDYEDLSGPAIERFLSEAVTSPWEVVRCLVPDEQALIEASLEELVDGEGCSVVVTTGGTGPAPRDVTPEATEAVCERMLPGFGEQMRAVSLRHVPTAVLSRQTAGIRGSCLILNLPGSRARFVRFLTRCSPPSHTASTSSGVPTSPRILRSWTRSDRHTPDANDSCRAHRSPGHGEAEVGRG